MIDKFVFSNGQDLSTLDSTGVISTNIYDLEEDETTDGQMYGWLNIIILATTNTGGDEGLWIELRTEDETNLNWDSASAGQIGTAADQKMLGALLLSQTDLVAGATFSIGICRAKLAKYVGLWYRAASSSLSGATTVDAFWSEHPVSAVHGLQKKPS